MHDLIVTLLSTTFLFAVIRTSTPLVLAALGGLVADLVGALNVALEGIMLTGALTSVLVSTIAPWWIAMLAGMFTGALVGAIMALFHLRYKADVVLVGTALNISAFGLTVFLLSWATGGDKGSSVNLSSKALPEVKLSWLNSIPWLGHSLHQSLSGHSWLTWITLLVLFALWFFLYRTPHGLRFRAVGEYAPAAEAAGISPTRYRACGLIASGSLAGLAGVQLAMFNYVGFTRDMTVGRGFIALGAVLLGARNPLGTALAAILFGLFEALSIALPALFNWMPGELIHTVPFVVTILALIVAAQRSRGTSPPRL
jgi:general nucleoside transport system permease protein